MKKLLLIMTLCVSGCMANSTDVSKEETGSVKQQLSSKSKVGPTARETARTMLESKVPEWAWEKVLKTPIPSRKGPAFERPREIARLFFNAYPDRFPPLQLLYIPARKI